ncbi:MAG: glycoside hydrolase family 2 protein [Bacteroidetes bacterium]|nr:glycoside hydrolase family 2 protein [Bacteroidota bacterium]
MNLITLNGEWEISSIDGTYNLTGEVPGSLFYSLEKQGEFGKEGVFYRENNRACLGIADRDFIYSRNFTIDADFLNSTNEIYLEADGLDTLTEVRLNGVLVGKTRNMHRQYRFVVSEHLEPGKNRIEITFFNSLEYIRNEHKRRPMIADGDDGVTTVTGYHMIRKSHCSFGWDWGPQIPDLGIWRDIRLVSYPSGRINTVHITQTHEESGVILIFAPDCTISPCTHPILQILVKAPDGTEYNVIGKTDKEAHLVIENPELWWPHGLGAQPLYEVICRLVDDKTNIHDWQCRVGLRTLTIEQKADEWGESFCFAVNGVPVFARGANYIPEDVYLTRTDRAKTEKLIQNCCEANFNSIRVWGGGVYPEDYFYDLCDEYGLIVWQDLMFACAIYDIRNDAFLNEIKEEIQDNLLRIRHHASLGLICGNNEMEWFFVDYDTFHQSKEQEFEYIKQYHIVIPEIVRNVCPEIFYWSSSPSSGGYFEEPNSADKGDCHYWAVWHGNQDFSEYKKHYFRFMSEFGFESFPAMNTIHSFTEPEDLNIFSPVMEEHQKRIGGNGKILNYIARYFRYPKDLDSLVYISQLSQSEALRHGIEHWRRNRGRCMGSIYWQLNDNWPVASWSSIDYYGRWKALHYMVKRAYNNILVSCDGDERSAAVYLANEGKTEVIGELEWWMSAVSGETLDLGIIDVQVDPFTSKELVGLDFSQDLIGNVSRDRVLFFRFKSIEGECFYGDHCFLPWKSLSLQEPNLSAVVEDSGNTLIITVRAQKPALFVELELADRDVVFSDNFFNLQNGIERTLFLKKDDLTVREIESNLRLRSLYNSYS